MKKVIGLDMETRSRVDLKKCGTDVYASDGTTEIICCSFVDKSDPAAPALLWTPPQPPSPEILQLLATADEIEAHNARFDQLIYEYIAVEDHGFPDIPEEKWVCTAAQCRVNALPGNLDGATRAVNAKHKKDTSGVKLIQQLCIPNKKTGKFSYNNILLYKMGEYCKKDSLAMIGLTAMMRPLSDNDKLDWQINERINDRGIKIDRELATLAQQFADDEKEELGEQLLELTNGAIEKVTQTARLLKTLKVEFADQRALMACIKKPKVEGEEQKYTLDKAARGALLACDSLPPHFRRVIDLIDQGGNSSVSKFSSMLSRADRDTDRVHGAFVFAGAGQTQRYSSKGLQLHNMRRDCWSADDTETLKGMMRAFGNIEDFGTLTVMDTLARLLRPAVIPEDGHKFVVGDWSSIEARCLPWLANSPGGEEALDIFRDGRDVYMETATSMGLKDRQLGKVANLSLGFGGASGAFNAMAKNYGVVLEDHVVKSIVTKWR